MSLPVRRRAPLLLAAAAAAAAASVASAFVVSPPAASLFGIRTASSPSTPATPPLFMSSYDMSDYSSSSSDYESDEPAEEKTEFGGPLDEDDAESDVKLHGPVPLSKNAGNRFVALIFDKALDRNGRDWEEMFENRTSLTHDHVFHCRKANLYNETFNYQSMVDVLYSYQVLSSCASRPIGHLLVMESTDLSQVKSFVSSDPVVQNLNCDPEDIPLYRWRHIKDHTLRIDDGRYGGPNVLIQFDRSAEELGGMDLRSRVEQSKLEYLIKSERVIAAGPLHLPTAFKSDPSSVPVGDLVFFNAKDREEAVSFAENDPAAEAGLYDNMRVHKYNSLDVTGKFVSRNTFDDGSGWYNSNLRMKDEMEDVGYPVDDEQTPWLNW